VRLERLLAQELARRQTALHWALKRHSLGLAFPERLVFQHFRIARWEFAALQETARQLERR
jgi:hypothetical protein